MHIQQPTRGLPPDENDTALQYILNREKLLDVDLLPYGNPRGKDVLIFGCGLGNEVLWAARHGAKSALGIDLANVSLGPITKALAGSGFSAFNFEMRRQDIHDLALMDQKFDLIVSNGVFEHVFDLRGVLHSFRYVLRPKGRIAIYADGLWYSSIGGHIQSNNYEHLWKTKVELHDEYPHRWMVHKGQLNRMTIVDFINAIRDVGLYVLQMKTRCDPFLFKAAGLMDKMKQEMHINPTDLSITSVGCELCFPEQL